MSERRERVVRWLAAILVAAGLVTFFVMRYQTQGLTLAGEAGHEAATAAQDSVVQILSYHSESLVDEIAADRALMTSDYATRHETMVLSQVLPVAEQNSVTNEVSVVSVGIVESASDHVIVLVFANQTTRTEAQPHGVTQGIRLEISLWLHDGDWLVDDIRPL